MTIDESGTGWQAAWRYNVEQEAAYRRRPSSGRSGLEAVDLMVGCHKTLCHHHDHQLRYQSADRLFAHHEGGRWTGYPSNGGAMEGEVKWR